MKDALPARVRLGAAEVNLRVGEVREGERAVLLQDQPFQILRMLIVRENGLVTREEIKKKFWPNDTVVEFDHSINAAIAKLRRALGDSAEKPRYIETIPRRGYRLLVPVEWLAAAEDSPGEASPQASGGDAAMTVQPDRGVLTGRTVSHYRVLDIIGGGGMGVVYRAEDLKLGRRVALKFLPEEMGTDLQALERFDREARAVSLLDHTNICTIHEFGEHEGRPFMVMQLLQGQTLRDRLAASEGPIPLEELLDVAIQVSAGLQAAHERGIIHRDIKPANIFITDKGVCKILDFGVAKLLEEAPGFSPANLNGEMVEEPAFRPADRDKEDMGLQPRSELHLTRTGSAMGTAGYMSPEQVRGEKLDARTDLFSFGLILYEMASGQRAFSGETAAIVQDTILHRRQIAVHDLYPEVTPELETIINKALEKNREDRYQTASALGIDLQHLGSDAHSARAGEPVSRKRSGQLWLTGLLLTLAASLLLGWLVRSRVQTPPEPTERQITANPLEDWVTGGAISPDGKYVAYHDQTGLYLRSIESGETHPLSVPDELRTRIFHLSWFPEGGKLLAEVTSSDGVDVWVITVLGEAKPRLLYRHASDMAISPDGRLIAFVGVEFGKAGQEVWVGGINGETPRKLVEAEETQDVFSPAWSPDGRWIAYAKGWKTKQGSWSSAIEIRPASGGPPKTLVADSNLPKSNTIIPASGGWGTENWAPDWRLVFMVTEIPEDLTLNRQYSFWAVGVKPRTGEAAAKPRRLTQWSTFSLSNLTVTADGRRLSYVKLRDSFDVYVAELGPDGASMKSPRRLTLDDRGSYASAWTRDGLSVLFDSKRNGRSEIFRQGLDENVAATVVAGSGDVSGGEMSPDGKWFLYWEGQPTAVAAETAPDLPWLMRRAVAGGSPERVLESSQAQAGAANRFYCSSNPKASSPCVLSQYEGKDLVFYSLDPLQGRGTRLGKIEVSPPDRYTGWSLSPDGSRLALVDADKYQGRIKVLALMDATWHEISLETTNDHLQSIGWAVDGKSFFVTSWTPESYDLLHVTDTGSVKPLARNGLRLWPFYPLSAPDGKHLAFQAQTVDGNVWLLENF